MAEIQARTFAQAHLKESRPKEKFTGSNKVNFFQQMRLLKNALDLPSVTDRQKLLELRHYFDGHAYEMITYCMQMDDAKEAFEEAIGALVEKFGKSDESALESIEELLKGKQLSDKDVDGVLGLYSKLKTKYYLAKNRGTEMEFNTRTVIDTIVHKRLSSSMAAKWFKKVVKYRGEKGKEPGFSVFLTFLNDEHTFLQRYNACYPQNSGQAPAASKAQGAKVAATGAAPASKGTPAGSSKAAPGSAPTASVTEPPKCMSCSQAHGVEECTTFKALSVEAKKKACSDAGACFRCGSPGHLARRCRSDAKCATCNKAHKTILHEVQVQRAPETPADAGASTTPA